jgi:transaldolase
VKLFLATDALDDVQWAAARGWCDGVVLPDDALRSAASPEAAVQWLAAFARAVPFPVLVDAADALASGGADEEHVRSLGRAADNVVLQLPFNDEHAARMRGLAASGIRVAATFVGTAAQALFAAKAGATYVLVDVDRLDAMSGAGAEVVAGARALLDAAHLEAELVALFPSGSASMAACGAAGADAAVVGTGTLRAMLAYPFTDQALAEAQRRPSGGQRLRAGDP